MEKAQFSACLRSSPEQKGAAKKTKEEEAPAPPPRSDQAGARNKKEDSRGASSSGGPLDDEYLCGPGYLQSLLDLIKGAKRDDTLFVRAYSFDQPLLLAALRSAVAQESSSWPSFHKPGGKRNFKYRRLKSWPQWEARFASVVEPQSGLLTGQTAGPSKRATACVAYVTRRA